MKLKFLFLLVVVAGILTACFKQEPKDISEPMTEQQVIRLQACKNTNFLKGLLTYENTLNLFVCAAWDQKFPNMYAQMNKIDGKLWNHAVQPLNNNFFDDKVRRDRVFSHLRELDKAGGLDDLGRVMTSLNETNFYDALKALFVCSEDSAAEACVKRSNPIPSKKSVKEMLKFVDLKPQTFKDISLLIRLMNKGIGKDKEEVRYQINQFFNEDIFVTLRLNFVSQIANKLISGLATRDRDFLDRLLTTKAPNDKDPWLYYWLHNSKMSQTAFVNLVRYTVDQNPNFMRDLKVVRQGFEEGLSCQHYSNEHRINLQLRTHVEDFLQKISVGNKKQYYEFALKNINDCNAAKPFCPVLSKYTKPINYLEYDTRIDEDHSINFAKVINEFSEFVSDDNRYMLLKFLLDISLKEAEDASVSGEEYIIQMMTDPFFENLNELNKLMNRYAPKYFEVIYRIAKRLHPNAFKAMANLNSELITNGENTTKMLGWAEAWRFFTRDEQNFLFNYIDAHLEEQTNYILLFDFYAKMMDELSEVGPLISKEWVEDEEKLERTFQSIKDLGIHFSGPETLKEFDVFFSRDHIIKVMKLVTVGPEIKSEAIARLEDIFSENYVLRSSYKPYHIVVDDDINGEVARLVNCLRDMGAEDNDFYRLVIDLPLDCKRLSSEEFTLKVFNWANIIAADYTKFNASKFRDKNKLVGTENIFDRFGLMSPGMLNNGVAMLKIIDKTLGPGGQNTAKKGGFSYFVDSLYQHLYQLKGDETGFQPELNSLIKFSAEVLAQDELAQRAFRNRLFYELAERENYNQIEPFLNMGHKIFGDYLDWVEDHESYQRDTNRPIAKYDKRFSCTNYLNQNIGEEVCPGPKKIKFVTKVLLNFLKRSNDRGTKSAIGFFLQAFIPGSGIIINKEKQLSDKNVEVYQEKKGLSLKEAIKMHYDFTNKNLPINNKKVTYYHTKKYVPYFVPEEFNLRTPIYPYIGSDNETTEVMTTMERIEVVIRDVRFDMGYLGAHYLNAVSKASNYDKTLEQKYALFKKCVPLKFCGKFLNKTEKRLGKNAVETFPGLMDANKPPFNYGDFMKVLLSALMKSSEKKSRKSHMVNVRIFGKKIEIPWVQTKKQLKNHNLHILGRMAELAGLSNVGRFIHDRFGRTEAEFKKFFESRELQLINDALLRGFPVEDSERIAVELFHQLVTVKNAKGQIFLDVMIDWLSRLSYQEMRFVENTLGQVLLISSYLGTPDFLYRKRDGRTGELKERYKDNNLFHALNSLTALVKVWPEIEKAFNQKNIQMMNVLKTANNMLYFFSERLLKEQHASDGLYYQFFNELYLIINKALLKEDIREQKGIDFVAGVLGDSSLSAQGIQGISDFYDYLETLHGTGTFREWQANGKQLLVSEEISGESLRNYLQFSAEPVRCTAGGTHCLRNYHYDEPSLLLQYVARENKRLKKSHFEILTDTLLVEEKAKLLDTIQNLTPFVSIEKTPVKIPLAQ